ncbi:hypothetical protein DL93DRAFT_2090101 [Clavulina sp. PMI_390]|nr:hypothetical protein DL93DRAFT_2090101 [Clavulina sp. PMI_390]
MRIRVLSRPPLPTIKAWFAVPDSNNNAGPSSLLQHELPISTINDLKFALCSKIHDLTNAAGPAEIKLLLDDFELLDQSPIEVLKDGDLVIIQHSSLRPSSIYSGQSTSSPAPHQARPVAVPNESRKRKRGDNPPPASNKPLIPRSLHRSSPPPISSSSSSSSESSTSSSSSSSSSESSSSLSTSSSEDDDSDSSSSSSSPSVYHARHPKRCEKDHSKPRSRLNHINVLGRWSGTPFPKSCLHLRHLLFLLVWARNQPKVGIADAEFCVQRVERAKASPAT